MLNPELLRNSFSSVKTALLSRGVSEAIIDAVSVADRAWRDELTRFEALKHEQKLATPKGKPSEEERQTLGKLSAQIKASQATLQDLDAKRHDMAMQLPNIPDEDVPVGADDSDNVVVKTVGDCPTFSFTPKSHDAIAQDLGLIEFERATKITGSRFVAPIGLGAKLERALINFMLDVHTTDHGCHEVMPAALVNSAALEGTGQLPKFADDLFKCDESDYWLSPTAEVQLTNFYQKEIIDHDDLPIQFTAYSPCFRREAGSYGKDMKGLIRLHQFNKVELVHFVHPDHSDAALDTLLGHASTILDKLELPYRTVLLCTGDLGFSSAKTYDLEVWLPSQNTYREISSCSTFRDFQSRRAMIRYKSPQLKKPALVHTLNGSGLAVGRTVAAILENYQQADGSVRVPTCLIPYLNCEVLSA